MQSQECDMNICTESVPDTTEKPEQEAQKTTASTIVKSTTPKTTTATKKRTTTRTATITTTTTTTTTTKTTTTRTTTPKTTTTITRTTITKATTTKTTTAKPKDAVKVTMPFKPDLNPISTVDFNSHASDGSMLPVCSGLKLRDSFKLTEGAILINCDTKGCGVSCKNEGATLFPENIDGSKRIYCRSSMGYGGQWRPRIKADKILKVNALLYV